MATVLVLLLGPSNCSTLLRAAFSFSCIQASDFTEVCSTQTLLGSPYPLEEVCSSPLIESPLFHLRVVMGCRYFSVQFFASLGPSCVCQLLVQYASQILGKPYQRLFFATLEPLS